MKNADENELKSIASDPDEIHMYNVNDFQFLLDIVDDLTVNLCNSVKGPGEERAERGADRRHARRWRQRTWIEASKGSKEMSYSREFCSGRRGI